MLLNGSETPLPISYTNRYGRRRSYQAHFEGADRDAAAAATTETGSQNTKEDLEHYMATRPCPACSGVRLKPEMLAVTVGGIEHLATFTALSRSSERARVPGPPRPHGARSRRSARQILKEIRTRLGFLKNVGLDYLTLDRAAATLAGGEAQRIRLATQIGSGLMGVLYILDEPSIGLHQRDNRRLIDTLHPPSRPGQHDPGRRARRGDHRAPPTGSSTSAPAPASTAGSVVAAGHAGEIVARPEARSPAVSLRRATDPGPGDAPARRTASASS